MIRFGTSNLVPKTTNTDFVFLNPTGLTLRLSTPFLLLQMGHFAGVIATR